MTTDPCCPLCDQAFDVGVELRVHLEVSHRKSELSELLVDALLEDEESPDTDGSDREVSNVR